jgi:hypothetical protein
VVAAEVLFAREMIGTCVGLDDKLAASCRLRHPSALEVDDLAGKKRRSGAMALGRWGLVVH